jgi:hypothetical protein
VAQLSLQLQATLLQHSPSVHPIFAAAVPAVVAAAPQLGSRIQSNSRHFYVLLQLVLPGKDEEICKCERMAYTLSSTASATVGKICAASCYINNSINCLATTIKW